MMDAIGDQTGTVVAAAGAAAGAKPAAIGSKPMATGAEEARLGWLALTLTPGMGPTRCGRAVRAAGSGRAGVRQRR